MKKTKKTPAKKRTAKNKRVPQGGLTIWRLLGWGCLLGSLVLCGWFGYLDVQVRDKFEGRKWALPARVYAQPLELYVGQQLTLGDLKAELKALEYERHPNPKRPGQVRYLSDGVEMFTRGFAIGADTEAPQRMTVRIKRSQVSELRQVAGPTVTFAQLEPPLIGGIYPRQQEDRNLVQLKDVPPLLGETLIAIEDRAFVDHWGVSPKAIARAAWVNLQSGRVVQGGSTLTQQLVKNFYLDERRSLSRKLVEAAMSLLLELHYSKAEILETYLNEVYLGQSGPRAIHGFGLASQHYFKRELKALKTEEIALLVGVVKGASFYNPWRNPERALQRRNLVIEVMQQQALIDVREARRAKASPLGVVNGHQRRLHAYPAFIDLVKRQLRADYSAEVLSSEGLKIYTTLSLRAQRHAEQALAGRLSKLEGAYGVTGLQGAVTLAAIGSGEVEAMVGDRNSQFAGFNRALNARRPIGSLVKPAVYLTALQNGYHLASQISDGKVTVAGPDGEHWVPRNFDRQSHGDVLLVDALVRSYNQATARLGMEVGLDAVVDTVRQLGVEGSVPAIPSMLLGAVAMSPFEVMGMYHTLANDGVRTPMRAIRSVISADGERLRRYPLRLEQSLSPHAVHLVQFAMQSVMQEGTGRSVYQTLPSELMLAGKTGTTNDQRDSWFAGFSGQHVAVAWIGRDDNGVTPLTGSSGSLKVWQDLFKRLPTQGLAIQPASEVEYLWVDGGSGGLSGDNCQGARLLPFLTSNKPATKAPCEWRKNPVYHWFRQWL